MVDFLEGGIRLFGKMLSKVVERLFFFFSSPLITFVAFSFPFFFLFSQWKG